MSVVIKGMKIPKSCAECPLGLDMQITISLCAYGCQAMLAMGTPKIRDSECTTKPTWCPLVELPPHGRLIDADELYTEMAKRKSYGELSAKSALRAVANAPTIIEAEG